MNFLFRLAWPLTFLGLVVVLAAVVAYFIQDSELERQWELALLDPDRRSQASTISQQRIELRVWPGVVVGAGITGLGTLLLALRRRFHDWGREREELEERFDDGRPVVFRPPGDPPE